MSSDQAREGQGASFATSRPVAVLMSFIAAVVFGYFSYARLSVRLMPEMSYPTITVRTEYEGAAPEEVEKDISRPVEEALGVISGLRRTSSVSRAGVSDVVLEFAWDTSMADAVQDTLEKLDLVVLPDDAGSSLILRFDPALEPVMELSLSSPGKASEEASSSSPLRQEAELRRLRRIAELQVKRSLDPVKGVAAARVRGGLEEEIHVRINSGALTSAGLSLARIISRLQEENINIAGGTIKDGGADYMVRTLNEYQSIEQIADTTVATIEGRAVRIRDLGTVTKSHRERDMVTRIGGTESVQIDVYKEADANMVALSKRVRVTLGEIDREGKRQAYSGPGGLQRGALAQELYDSEQVELSVVADRSLFIESSIREVRDTAILGGLFAVLVLFLFLKSVKSTLIIGVSIPISLLVTFAPLNLLGVSLNIMSLGGLALGVGMLVDSSIVVLESIYRNREEGLGFMEATIRGTEDVRGAVVASTLTTLGVFLPMVFVDGVAGQAFGDLGLAVVLSLMTSLVVALYLLPMLASRRWQQDADEDANETGGARAQRASLRFQFFAWDAFLRDLRALPIIARVLLGPVLLLRLVVAMLLEVAAWLFSLALHSPIYLLVRFVVPVLAKVFGVILWLPLFIVDSSLSALHRGYPKFLRWAIANAAIVMTLMLLCLGLTYWSATRLESELLPEVHQGEFTFELALPVGTPIEVTAETLAEVETSIRSEVEGIDSLIVTYGYDATSSRRSDEGEHTAKFKVLLADDGDNAASEERIAQAVRKRLSTIPDLSSRLVRPVLFSFRTPIEVEVYGDDLLELRRLADRVKLEMEGMKQLSDVESTLRRGAPEVQIVYDRARIRRYQLNIASVAELVRDEVKGRMATRFNRKDRKVPVVVRLAEEDRASVDDMERLIVDPEKSGTIRLASVASVSLGEGPSEVRRVDGQRVAIVRANLREGAALGSTVKLVQAQLVEKIAWPANMDFAITGQNEEWERSQSSLWLALGLSIFLVYVIMASQFESLVYPLVIMLTIPLAFLGTFLTLDLLEIHLSIIVFLGMIMLAGIVVNNAIVLVDYINTLKGREHALEDAVVMAGEARLRPILMTTVTTVLGLGPMALGLGDGAELRTPLAIAVISGLVASTVLTLVIIPTLYVVVDRSLLRIRHALGGFGS